MSPNEFAIHRFVIHAKPSQGNKQFEMAETATLLILLKVTPNLSPEKLLADYLKRHKWMRLRTDQADVLNPDRVKSFDDESFKAMYNKACERGDYIYVIPDQFGGGKKGKTPLMPRPEFGESFFDGVIEQIGGRRLSIDEKNNEKTRNADYLFDDYVVELKELMESPLEKKEKQSKIAEIFLSEIMDSEEIELNFELLSDVATQKCFECLGSPIKNALKSASDQLKETKKFLKLETIKSVAILVNSGFNFVDSDVFNALAYRYCKKDSKSIDLLICVHIMVQSNGFDEYIVIDVDSNDKSDELFANFAKAISIQFQEHLAKWIKSGIPGGNPALDSSIGFEFNEHTFYWSPPGKKWIIPDGFGNI